MTRSLTRSLECSFIHSLDIYAKEVRSIDYVEFGLDREKRIRCSVLQFQYIDTNMIIQQHFQNTSGGIRKARQVLQRLAMRGDLIRFKPSSRSAYIYHVGKRSRNWRHIYTRNIFHFALLKGLRGFHSLWLEFEFPFGGGQADGFYIVKNSFTKSGVKFFLEVDIREDKFDKVYIYNKRFEDKSWHELWWADPVQSGKPVFPRIIVFTTRPGRVKQAIEKQNKAGLQFVVVPVSKEVDLAEVLRFG